MQQLDCAYGSAPELYQWFRVPPRFSAGLELPERAGQAGAVLFGVRRLLLQLAGWLAAQQLAAAALVLWLEYERGRVARPPEALRITLGQAAWREDQLLVLFRERLARLQLAAPVLAMRLEVERLEALAPPPATLFPEPGGSAGEQARLLLARLGPGSVLRPAPLADWRPERGNRWLAIEDAAPPVPAVAGAGSERPFWLLAAPLALPLRGEMPCHGGPLRLVGGPERIESGWWDEACAMRDYFIGEDAQGVRYWLYRERGGAEEAGPGRWFLHGLFG